MSRSPAPALLALLLAGCAAVPDLAPARPHVLFVCIDDLRPQLACDGHPFMHTPHLDRLAAEGTRFTRHFVQVPTCGASRRALWTGRLPEARADLGNGACERLGRAGAAAPPTLPQWLRAHGYRTEAIGKISHTPDGWFDPDGVGPAAAIAELPGAWDASGCPPGRWGSAWNAFFGYADGSTRAPGRSPPVENAEVDDHGYPDAWIADEAIDALARLRDGDRPFFLAVGFFKPHLPFTAPYQDLERYDPAAVGLSPWPEPPDGVPAAYALHPGAELCRNYGGLPRDGRLSDAEALRVRRAYCAAVTYVDRQVGRVLDALEQLGLADDTIVVVWGDHGWHLGDLGVWGKHTLFDHALRSALIVRGLPGLAPGVRDDVVESIALFPTLSAACGVDAPTGLDGVDLRAARPDGLARAAWTRGGAVGRTVRTAEHRLTLWEKDGERVAAELYEQRAGPVETRNLAGTNVDLVEALARFLPPPPER
jgi:arylsulfatase A-like enzyme